MKYLLDTNHCSFLQGKHPEVIRHFRNLTEDAQIMTNVVNQAELLTGIELVKSEKRKQELHVLYEQIIVMTSDILKIDSNVAKKYSEIFVELKKKGKPIQTNDIWIAAIAKVHDLILITNDSGFRYISDLVIEDWTKPIDKNLENENL